MFECKSCNNLASGRIKVKGESTLPLEIKEA